VVLGLIGLAIAFNRLWLLVTLVRFALVIWYVVIARDCGEVVRAELDATTTADPSAGIGRSFSRSTRQNCSSHDAGDVANISPSACGSLAPVCSSSLR
jgi:hypothetical protein